MLRLINPKYNYHISKIKITNESLYTFHKSNQFIQTRNAFTINAAINTAVKWITDSLKPNFINHVLSINIAQTFAISRDLSKSSTKGIYLSHSNIDKLNKQLLLRSDSKKLNGASSWSAYFGPSRCGMTLGFRKAIEGVNGVAYVSLGKKTDKEDLYTFMGMQLQRSRVSKLHKLEAKDLRDAMIQAIKQLEKRDIYPILILDGCEYTLNKERDGINSDMKQLLEILLSLSDNLTVYLLCNDIRFFQSIKQINEIREHTGFKNWRYASYKETCQFIRDCNLPITEGQLKSTAESFLGHNGDLSDYVSFIRSGATHQQAYSKIINRGYLKIREALLHPPNYCKTQQSKMQYRVIIYSLFYSIHTNFYNHLVKDNNNIEFPVNYCILASLSKIHSDIITNVDSSITLDDVFFILNYVMGSVYNIAQAIELPDDPFNGTGDLWVTWSSPKLQHGFELVEQDPLIQALMKESKWDFEKFKILRPKWDSDQYTLTYKGLNESRM